MMSWFLAPKGAGTDMSTQPHNRKSFNETVSVTNIGFCTAYPPYFKEENKQDFFTCMLSALHPSIHLPLYPNTIFIEGLLCSRPQASLPSTVPNDSPKTCKSQVEIQIFFFKYILPTLILGGKNSSKLMEYGKLHKSINNYVIQVF